MATDITQPRSHDTSRIAWAKLMARGGEEFPLACPNCGGDIRIGGGITYAGTERVTFDVGYRFSGLEGAGPRTTAGENELLFAIRIDEPFRGLWRDTGR